MVKICWKYEIYLEIYSMQLIATYMRKYKQINEYVTPCITQLTVFENNRPGMVCILTRGMGPVRRLTCMQQGVARSSPKLLNAEKIPDQKCVLNPRHHTMRLEQGLEPKEQRS